MNRKFECIALSVIKAVEEQATKPLQSVDIENVSVKH